MTSRFHRALHGIVEHLNGFKQTSETKARKLDRELQKVQGSLEKVVSRSRLRSDLQVSTCSQRSFASTGGGCDSHQGEVRYRQEG